MDCDTERKPDAWSEGRTGQEREREKRETEGCDDKKDSGRVEGIERERER